MNEQLRRSLRILIDLQACQTNGSGPRGVGRYSKSLFSHLTTEAKQIDFFVHMANHLPFPVNLDGFPADRVLRSPSIPNWKTDRSFSGGEQDTLDALALSAFIRSVNADIIHVSHIFEGCEEQVALPSLNQRLPGQIISATLYDLIPMVFPEQYFQDTNTRKWYMSRLAWLRNADLLLSISDSTKQDAIAFLGIEPWRIVTIHGGVSSHFTPPSNRNELRNQLTKKYGISNRFVLYTGGDDYRKNIEGAVAGFATISPELRNNYSLVIVCEMSEERKNSCLRLAKSAGLSTQNIIFAGSVSEQDLVAFYNTCDLFIFPSLYEGLGFPVLEAMACGAPVIGGNNSSIKEIIGRSDALFDSASHKSIGEAISNVLTQPDFAENLREYGLKKVQEFTWERTANLALEAFGESLARNRESSIKFAMQGWIPKNRLAMFTPLPPCRSGIADYNAQFLPFLSRYFEIDLFVDNYKVVDETLTSSFRIFKAENFDKVADHYDAILYEFGNSEFHAHMLPLLEKHPGVVGLHDAYLSGLFGYLDFNLGNTNSYPLEMLDAHGPLARHYFAPIQKCYDANSEAMINLPCTKKVLNLATGVISH